MNTRRTRRANTRAAAKAAERLGLTDNEQELWLILTSRYMEQLGYTPKRAAARAAEAILVTRTEQST